MPHEASIPRYGVDVLDLQGRNVSHTGVELLILSGQSNCPQRKWAPPTEQRGGDPDINYAAFGQCTMARGRAA